MRNRFVHVIGASEPGSLDVPNQDRWGHVDDAVWVIDGATNLDKIAVSPSGDDGEWIASALNDYLLSVKWSEYNSIADVIREAIGVLWQQYMPWLDQATYKPTGTPSAAIAVVRRVDRTALEYFVLGDCSVTVFDPVSEEEEYFTNRDIMDLDAVAISELAKLMESGLSFAEARKGISETLRKNRSLMNTPGGYWIVSLDPEAPKHATQGTIEGAEGLEFMLASDGFSRFWDLFHMNDRGWGPDADPRIDGLNSEIDLELTIEVLRQIERDDADVRLYPRFKVSDDATVAICRFGK